jgi:hypothetical protein
MDPELLVALIVFWISTTAALVTFLMMWFANDGEAFHPHSVDVDTRHSLFAVVNSETKCKYDFVVKNISAYVAPRGSSSSKQFTAICMMVAVSGFLGTYRWYKVGDATGTQALLACIGFTSLILVASCELDVVPERFLEDKLMITSWLLHRLGDDKKLPFTLEIHNKEFLEFIRSSEGIYHLYEEDIYIQGKQRNGGKSDKHSIYNLRDRNYNIFWVSLHMMGALGFILLITTSIILNDIAEEKVAWITGAAFLIFCCCGYLTGQYLPILNYFKCWIMVWNPFLREPFFMLRLQQAVINYNNRSIKVMSIDTSNDSVRASPLITPRGSTLRKSPGGRPTKLKQVVNDDSNSSIQPNTSKINRTQHGHEVNEFPQSSLGSDEIELAMAADKFLDTKLLRWARYQPKSYLRLIGHILVMTELIALLTPAVAMGLQWATALCENPPIMAIIELLWLGLECIYYGECSNHSEHCIIKHSNNI